MDVVAVGHQIPQHPFRQLEGDFLLVETGQGSDAGQGALDLADIGGDVGRDVLQHLRTGGQPL